MSKEQYKPSPCQDCLIEPCTFTCREWYDWFGAAWKEVTEPIRKIFDEQKGKTDGKR